MTAQVKTKPQGFTGRHMVIIMVSFFGVIISVNVLMAYFANSTWSGLVAKNSYVASQEYNLKAAEARKWLESGITGDLAVTGADITYRLVPPAGKTVVADTVVVDFRRPVGTAQDFQLTLGNAGSLTFAAAHPVLPGEWIVDLKALDGKTVVYHEARRIHVGEVLK